MFLEECFFSHLGKFLCSRHYIHAEDVASAVLFLVNYKGDFEPTWGGAKCPKFNIVGSEELNNLQLAQIIAEAQDKELKYELYNALITS